MTESGNEETLFARALELPEAERRAFLDQACGDNAELRSSIELLLRAHGVADVYLPKMGDDGGPAARSAAQIEEQPGDWIGRYKLLQKIGEGGCGIVYMAEQEEPVRRRVALKVIKLGMDTKAVVARFDAERQALAMMDHPNIAKVLDAGATDSGRPFFVMELVRGVPVTKYCDENGLSTEKRLELFSRICLAIQHAHQKGIIHRDIKPSNILVTLHDGLPTPKVIDFGIAKATQGKLTDQTLFTAFEQFIGTPAYMSPEQAEMSGLDIDTRSDVYSLGVLLYELLAGRQPFDPKTFVAAGLDEMRRVIREVDPPKPSIRLSTLTEADQTTVAKLRGMAPAQLSMVLAGDLDWIVMRCLEKDRTRRYTTPSELVADIQRHLRNEPVIARPPNTGYLLRKLIRRHKAGFAAGTAVAISLIAGLIVSSVLLVRERAAHERAVVAEAMQIRLREQAEGSANQARSAAAKSAQVARFMTDMLDGVGPSVALGRDTKVLRDILDNTVRRLDAELGDQPAVAADLRDTLGAVYIDLRQYAAAEPLLHAAVATHRTASGNQSAEAAASLHLLGKALRGLNKPAEAETVLQEALTIRRKLFGDESPLVADTLIELARVALTYRRISVARTLLEEALAIRRKAFGPEHPAVATVIFNLALAASAETDHIEAARLHEEALAMRRRLLDKDHPDIADSLDRLGFNYAHELDRKSDATAVYRESFTIRRKVLGDAHPAMVVSLLRFAGQQPAKDIMPDTLALAREFVASQRKMLPSDSPLLGPTLLALATLEDTPDRHPAEAQELYSEAHRIFEQTLAKGTPFDADIIDAMMFFGWSKFVCNVPAEGLLMGDESLKLDYAAFGTGRIGASWSGNVYPTHTLAWVYVGLGRQAEAVKLFESALGQMRSRLRDDFPMVAADVAGLGACYRAVNRVADAHQLLETSLASLETKSGKAGPGPHIAFARCQFGLTLLHEGRYAEAEIVLRRAMEEYSRSGLKALPQRMHPREIAMSGLGQTLAAQGKFAEAEPLVTQAFQDLQAKESRLAGNPAGMVRDAYDAVIALYVAWDKPERVAEWKAKFPSRWRRHGDAPMKRTLKPFAMMAVLAGTFPLAAQTSSIASSDKEKEEPVKLSPFVVSSSASSAGRYTSFEATSSGRTRVDIMDSVQNFSVITSELMEDVAGSRVVDAARFVAGVTDSSLPTSWERTNIRGFMGDGRTMDGFTYGAYPFNGVMNQDPALFDRMEIVKGPSSILAPQPTSPGGTINLITKKPQFGNFGLVNLQWGQFDANAAFVDVNRVVNGKLAVRLVASRRDYEHWWNGAYVQSTTVMPEFTYQITPSTQLTVQYIYADWDAANYFGLPVDPSSGTLTKAHILGGVPHDLDIYADDVVRTDAQQNFKVLLTTELWHGIQMRLAADYHTVNLYVVQLSTGTSTGGNGGNYDPLTGIWNPGLQYQQVPPYASSPLTAQATRSFRRGGTTLDTNPCQFQVQNDYSYVFENETLRSATLVGFAYKDAPESNSESYNIMAPTFDIDHYVDTSFTRGTINYHRHNSSSFRQAFFSENLGVAKNRLILSFSGSRSNFDSSTQDVPVGAVAEKSTSVSVPSYGAVLKPWKDTVSLYYTHSEQSSPTGAATAAEPSVSTARQEEFGGRFKVWDGKLFFTVAHYDIVHDNYAVANPGNLAVPPPQPLLPPLYSDRLAKGWEYELRANLNQNLAVIGAYTRFTNRDPNNVEFRGIAETAGSLLVSYAFGQESAHGLDGFRIVVGVDYLGKRPGDTPTATYTVASTPANPIPNQPSFYLGARTLVNLILAYDSSHHWDAQVNVDNLLDEEYLMASNIRNGVFPGTPTNVRVSLRYRF